MSREAQALLEAFEQLPDEEKRTLANELLRRLLPWDSGPLDDREIGTASDHLFDALEEECEHPAAR